MWDRGSTCTQAGARQAQRSAPAVHDEELIHVKEGHPVEAMAVLLGTPGVRLQLCMLVRIRAERQERGREHACEALQQRAPALAVVVRQEDVVHPKPPAAEGAYSAAAEGRFGRIPPVPLWAIPGISKHLPGQNLQQVWQCMLHDGS